MYMVHFIEKLASSNDGYLVLLMMIWFATAVIDFILGVLIPTFSKDDSFSSSKLKIGLTVKICQLALMVLVLVPFGISIGTVGLTGVSVLITGFIIGELYSVLGHLRLVDDKSMWLDTVEEFLKKLKN